MDSKVMWVWGMLIVYIIYCFQYLRHFCLAYLSKDAFCALDFSFFLNAMISECCN